MTSIFWPICIKAGSSAVTITPATAVGWIKALGSSVRPIERIMFLIAWTLYGTWVVWSPVPASPATSPKPISWIVAGALDPHQILEPVGARRAGAAARCGDNADEKSDS